MIKLDLKDAYLAVLIAPQHHISAFPPLPMAGGEILVQSASIGSEFSSIHLHQHNEASGGLPQKIGDQTHPLFGQHASSGPVRGEITATPGLNSEAFSVSKVPSEPEEECAVPYKEIRIPGSQIILPGLPRDKVHAITQLARSLSGRDEVILRHLARIVGKMVAAHPAILPAPLHYCFVEGAKSASLR